MPPTVRAFAPLSFIRLERNLKKPGNVLLSHSVPRAVPSAPKGLASVFEMGTGVSPSSWLPGFITIPIKSIEEKSGDTIPIPEN